jgi:large subunit ribosomal protein L21
VGGRHTQPTAQPRRCAYRSEVTRAGSGPCATGRIGRIAFVPKSDGSLSAVIVSGGKQYRVAPGDQILVDRLADEPGSSIKLGRVLLLRDGSDIKVGAPGIDGIDVDAKVLAHRRGPRIETLRYKSKKRVRVHRGGRADLTAIEILAIGGLTEATRTETKTAAKDAAPKAKPEKKSRAKPAVAVAAAAAEKKTETSAGGTSAPRRAKKPDKGSE